MTTSGKVLVVDDDDDLREATAMILRMHGYDVVEAEHGLRALEVYEGEGADLILLDMRMPVMNAWDFVAELRRRHARVVPILVVTAAADARTCAEEVGADGWLVKPFDIDLLLRTVEKHLHAARQPTAT